MYVCEDLLKITSLTRGPADTQQFTACDIGILNKHGDHVLVSAEDQVPVLCQTLGSLCLRIRRSHEERIAALCSECEKLF